MTTHTDFAAPIDRRLYDAPGRPAVVPGAHPAAVHALAPAPVTPPSLRLPVANVEHRQPDAPLPGTVPNTVYDPHRPLQHLPNPPPAAYRPAIIATGIGLDPAHGAAQLAAVANSKARLDRARAYATRLGARLAELQAKLIAASEHQVAAAISEDEPNASDLGPLRGEAIEVARLHGQALAILADVEAEHARHEADAAALFGSDGAARAKLAEAHGAWAEAQTAADAAKTLLDRARAHAEAVDGKLAAARASEARYDGEATARLRSALVSGNALPAMAEAYARTSLGLEDDLRHARAAVDKLAGEHAGKLADLGAADLSMKVAVDDVLCAEAEAMARELAAADARVLALRTRLHCYAKRTAGDYLPPTPKPSKMLPNGMYEPDPDIAKAAIMGPRLVRQTPVISQVVASAPLPPHQGPYAANWEEASSAWGAYAMALAADPQAEPAFADRPSVPPAPPLPNINNG